MAEKKKADLADAVNRPLQELTFTEIIGGPLRACVDAQQEAAMTTYEYLKAIGFQPDPEKLADWQPTPVTFYFYKEGVMNRLTIPLLSILPLPYLQIGRIDLRFQATVSGEDKKQGVTKFTFAPTTATVEKEGEGERNDTSELRARESIDIRIRAGTSDLPAGMAKVMEILNTQMTDLYELKEEEPEPPALPPEAPPETAPEKEPEKESETKPDETSKGSGSTKKSESKSKKSSSNSKKSKKKK